MRPKKLLVIGGVAAGTKAASKARRDDPAMEILIITDEDKISYACCGLAYYIGGVVENRSNLFARSPEAFREKQGIDVLLRHRAEKINTHDKSVEVKDLDTGITKKMQFDNLLIATGSVAVKPPIEGKDLKGVFVIHNVDDADSIIKYISDKKVTEAIVVGSGYIGIEAVENLLLKGIKCRLFESESRILPRMFDSDISGELLSHVRSKGVEVYTGSKVEKIEGCTEGFVRSVIVDGKEYPCGMVILASGVSPNVKLAKDAMIAIGSTGAIRVNSYMETSIRGIYAAGDCVETINLVSRKPGWYPLGSTANKQGRVAGANIVGGNKKKFEGVLGTSINKVFDLAAARTGLSESEAKAAGYQVETVMVTTPAIAGYYPGGGKVTLKLIADPIRKKLLGAQAFGDRSVDKVIDTIASALTGSVSIPDLANLDVSYAPPYAPAMGIVIVAAGILEEKLYG